MKSDKLFTHCINQKKLLKKILKSELNQWKYKIDAIFMNSKNIKTSKPHVLILNLTDK